MKKYGFLAIWVLVYIIGGIVGFVCSVDEFHTTPFIHENNYQGLYNLSQSELFIVILKNNLIVALKNMLLGLFSLGILSLIYTFYNGLIFGIVLGKSTHMLSVYEILKATVPHSCEFIGLSILGFIGFVISFRLFTKKWLLKKLHLFWLFLIGIFIILITAILESYVSIS